MSKAEELESLMAVLSIKEQRIKELESQVGSIREQVSLLSAAVAPTTKKLHNPVEIDKPANIRVQVNPRLCFKIQGSFRNHSWPNKRTLRCRLRPRQEGV